MSINVEWDVKDEKEIVKNVTVYQKNGSDNYGIFARNPVQTISADLPHCEDFYSTSLYRMTLEHYNNMENLNKKRDSKIAKLQKMNEERKINK